MHNIEYDPDLEFGENFFNVLFGKHGLFQTEKKLGDLEKGVMDGQDLLATRARYDQLAEFVRTFFTEKHEEVSLFVNRWLVEEDVDYEAFAITFTSPQFPYKMANISDGMKNREAALCAYLRLALINSKFEGNEFNQWQEYRMMYPATSYNDPQRAQFNAKIGTEKIPKYVEITGETITIRQEDRSTVFDRQGNPLSESPEEFRSWGYCGRTPTRETHEIFSGGGVENVVKGLQGELPYIDICLQKRLELPYRKMVPTFRK